MLYTLYICIFYYLLFIFSMFYIPYLAIFMIAQYYHHLMGCPIRLLFFITFNQSNSSGLFISMTCSDYVVFITYSCHSNHFLFLFYFSSNHSLPILACFLLLVVTPILISIVIYAVLACYHHHDHHNVWIVPT